MFRVDGGVALIGFPDKQEAWMHPGRVQRFVASLGGTAASAMKQHSDC